MACYSSDGSATDQLVSRRDNRLPSDAIEIYLRTVLGDEECIDDVVYEVCGELRDLESLVLAAEPEESVQQRIVEATDAAENDMMEQLEECIDRTGDSWREGMKRLRVELDKIAKIVDLPGTPSIEEIVDELEILDATLREEC